MEARPALPGCAARPPDTVGSHLTTVDLDVRVRLGSAIQAPSTSELMYTRVMVFEPFDKALAGSPLAEILDTLFGFL